MKSSIPLLHNHRWTLYLLTLVALLLTHESVPGQERLKKGAVVTPAASDPKLWVNQLSEEWDDWVYTSDGSRTAYSATLPAVTQFMDVKTKRTIATIPSRGMLAVTEDGATLAVGTRSGDVLIWGVRGLRELAPKHDTQISQIDISRDGRWVVTGDSLGVVKFWNVSAERLEWSAKFRDSIQALALSSDGSSVLVCWGSGALAGTVHSGSQILSGKTGKLVKELDDSKGYGVIVGTLSDDGTIAATVKDATQGIKLWDLRILRVKTLLEHRTIADAALSSDGKRLAVLDDHGVISLVDTATGAVVTVDTQSSPSFPGFVRKVQFIRGGEQVAAAVFGFGSVILSAKDGSVIETVSVSSSSPVPMESVSALASGGLVLGESSNLTVLWDLERGALRIRHGSETYAKNIVRIPLPGATPEPCSLRNVTLSPDGATVAGVLCNSTIVVISPGSGDVREYDKIGELNVNWARVLRFSDSGRLMLAAVSLSDGSKHLAVWDRRTGAFRSFPLNNKKEVTLAGFDASERHAWVVLGRDIAWNFDGHDILIIDLVGDEKVKSQHVNDICDFQRCGRDLVSVSPDGRFMAYASLTGGFRLRDLEGNSELPLEDHGIGYAITPAFSCDGKEVLYGNSFGSPILFDIDRRTAKEGRPFKEILGNSLVEVKLTFSCQDQSYFVLTGGGRLFRFPTKPADGAPLTPIEYKAAFGTIQSFSEVTKGRNLLMMATSTGIDILERSGKRLVSLIILKGGPWVVISPEGRFDTDDPESLPGLSWIMEDDPLRPLPVDMFMRDYYEPKLLKRLVEGEVLPKVKPLQSLNRAQPVVEVVSARLGTRPDLADVTVAVAEAGGDADAGPGFRLTGAYDLRLFREGQLVAQWPEPKQEGEGLKAGPNLTPAELKAWQDATRIALDPKTGKATRTFTVRLPHGKAGQHVQFSAYAFNDDRVKSAVATQEYKVPEALEPVRPRAYVISVGINTYEEPSWKLRFAASDASLMQRVLVGTLKARYEVVPISLISDYKVVRGVIHGPNYATRAVLRNVLRSLAGEDLQPFDALKGVVNANQLRRAEPDDLVLLTVSSHGYTDADGRYYLIPSNSGRLNVGGGVNPRQLRQWVSSDDLSEWLRGVDAGELILIVDTCHSAGAIEEPGFKPGPMGSRGLGQLAYDKGVRVLAASQADDVALEAQRLEHGLLTYALIREGLEAERANTNKDGKITLDEWLTYGAERVPTLYEELKTGRLKPLAIVGRDPIPVKASGALNSVKKNAFQQPALFNFKRKNREVVIVEVPPQP